MTIKRIFDFIVSLIGLIVLSPVFLLIAICIKTDSKGPVFYSQERIGYLGKPFRILKFRTMTEDASGLPLTVGDDIRLTKCSRFLRKLKLDELPQLINVLKGDMCIVGPRPDMPWQLDMYTSRERARILVLPGITGLTQIMNRRELSNADNYELDVCYVERSTI